MPSNTPSKYTGLDLIVNKHAMRKQAGVGGALLGAADISSYFIPGVRTGRFALDAVRGYGRGIKNLARGNWKRGLGGIGTGVADTLFGIASAIPGFGMLTSAGRAARIAALAGQIGLSVGSGILESAPTKEIVKRPIKGVIGGMQPWKLKPGRTRFR